MSLLLLSLWERSRMCVYCIYYNVRVGFLFVMGQTTSAYSIIQGLIKWFSAKREKTLLQGVMISLSQNLNLLPLKK